MVKAKIFKGIQVDPADSSRKLKMGQANNDRDNGCKYLIYSKLLRRGCRYRLTSSLCPLPKHVSRLVTPNTSTPHTTLLLILVRAKQPHVSKAKHSIVLKLTS
jgi:hypothetical protein